MLKYTQETLYAMRFTGGEEYLDQLEIWEVSLRIYPGRCDGFTTFKLPE